MLNVKPKGYEWKIVLILSLIWGMVALDRLAIVYLFPVIIPEFNLSNAQAGAITSILALTWGVSSWLMGFASDRVGRKKVLVPSAIFFSLMSWFTGLTKSFGSLMIVRGLMGVGEGSVFSTGVATIAEESTPTRRGLNIGLFQSMFALFGIGLGAMIATQLQAQFGWRPVMFIVGIPGIILALILAFFMKEPPSIAQRAEKSNKNSEKAPGFFAAFKYRNIWVSTIVSCLFMNWLYNSTTFAALFLTDIRGLALPVAGGIISMMGFGGFVGMITVPGLSDHFGRKPMLFIATLLAGLFTFLFAYADTTPMLLGALLFIVGFFGLGSYPIWLSTIPTESVPVQLSGSAVGAPTAIGETFGAVLMPIIGGALADAFGLQAPMYLAAISPVIAMFVSILYLETAPKIVTLKAQKGLAG